MQFPDPWSSSRCWIRLCKPPSVFTICRSRVLEGLGRMLVIAVGPNSQQGQISTMVTDVETSGDSLR